MIQHYEWLWCSTDPGPANSARDLDLDHAKDLAAISRILDSNPKIAELVWQDL
jgi:hypothetical protein